MNLVKSDVDQYIEYLVSSGENLESLWIAPQALQIAQFKKDLKSVPIGLQNAGLTEKGSFTGENSLSTAQSYGVEFVILGHSERREVFGESPDEILKKIQTAQAQSMKVIYCVGENLEDRKNNRSYEAISDQLQILTEVKKKNVYIAYEPLWAIGTGLLPSPEDISNMNEHIHNSIGFWMEGLLYGGSVKPENVHSLKKSKHLGGFLVGGASLDPAKLLKLLKSVG